MGWYIFILIGWSLKLQKVETGMGGKVLLVDFMRVSMDKNEENEEIETSLMEIKIFISCSSIEGGK